MACGRKQHVLEMTENIRTDRVAFIAGQKNSALSFAVVHVEVVEPEINKHLFELMIGINSAIEFVVNQLAVDEQLWLRQCHRFPSQPGQPLQALGSESTENLLARFR